MARKVQPLDQRVVMKRVGLGEPNKKPLERNAPAVVFICNFRANQ